MRPTFTQPTCIHLSSRIVWYFCHYFSYNSGFSKCVKDDTKAAARQSPNYICKNKKIKYGEKRFSMWRMELLHPAMWQVALG